MKSTCNMIKTLGSPFKFFGYYYLNRSSIRHANPINDVRFQRLVITIFGVTGLLLFFKGYYISKHIFYLLVWTEKGCLSFLTIGFWCQTIHKKFLRRFDTIFCLKMMVKSGLEKIILKFHDGRQSYCCPVQKYLPRKAELAWQVSRYL